jgi:hypothetical protein
VSHLPHSSVQCWYDKIAALLGFLKHLGLHLLQLVRVVATLTGFLKKSKLVSVECGLHKNFNSECKIKGRVNFF